MGCLKGLWLVSPHLPEAQRCAAVTKETSCQQPGTCARLCAEGWWFCVHPAFAIQYLPVTPEACCFLLCDLSNTRLALVHCLACREEFWQDYEVRRALDTNLRTLQREARIISAKKPPRPVPETRLSAENELPLAQSSSAALPAPRSSQEKH